MVVLRATQKLLKRLPPSSAGDAVSDTALGDWYVNRIVVDRKPLLLLVSSTSLLAILEPARNLRELPNHLPSMVSDRLKRLGVDIELIGCEMNAMTPVCVGPTREKSVLGTLVDFAKTVPYHLPTNGWDMADIRAVESRLEETPCRLARRLGGVVFPKDEAPQKLEEKWGAPGE